MRPPGYRFSDCFKEVSETVMYGLRALGHNAEIRENAFRVGAQHIVFGGHMLAPDSSLAPGTILYNLEQLGVAAMSIPDALAKRYTIWDFAKPNCEKWAEKGIKAVHVPIGYSPEMTRIPPAEEDVDVLFYGSISPRRRAILEQLQKAGIKLAVAVNNAYGPELDALIARAKVILNVHFCDASLFEIVRVGYALANKKAVVSELAVDDYPSLKDGIKAVPYLALVDAVLDLVRDRESREALAENGFDLFSQLSEAEYIEAALNEPN